MGWTFYNSSGQRLSSAATNIAVLDIDGATDIGAAIVDADLFIIDDGAGGTNRKTAASRIKTYIGSAPVFGRVVRTAGNITTTSTSLVDVTGATVTFTTGAFPVQFNVSQSSFLSTVDDYFFNVDVDSGTLMFGAIGLYVHASDTGVVPSSFSGQTAALTAAEHTIKEQWKVGAGTGTLIADSNFSHMFSAHEIR
jgi:hypothetical protein